MVYPQPLPPHTIPTAGNPQAVDPMLALMLSTWPTTVIIPVAAAVAPAPALAPALHPTATAAPLKLVLKIRRKERRI